MNDKSFQEQLKDAFTATSFQDWVHIASKEIEGKNPERYLRSQTADGLELMPYYDKEKIDALNYSLKAPLAPAFEPFSSAQSWVNLPKLVVGDEEESNAAALKYLNSGADGILFDIQAKADVNLSNLLKDINWTYCNLSFMLKGEQVALLSGYVEEKNLSNVPLLGTLFIVDFAEQQISLLNKFSKTKIYTHGINVQPSTPVEEIAQALLLVVHRIDQNVQQGLKASDILTRITFRIEIDANFMINIAKLKALRLLFVHVAEAYTSYDFKPSDLYIYAYNKIFLQENLNPRGNLLQATNAAMAAILGGCDALTITSEEERSITFNRIAINVSNILKEESYFDKVADPTEGAYVLQAMIHQVSTTAWNRFLEIVK